MRQADLKYTFSEDGLVVLPVIHVIDGVQTNRNIRIAMEGGCKGVFLINHDFGVEEFLPIIRNARSEFSEFWIGVNFLAVTGKVAFPVLAELEKDGIRIDGYWGDDARIEESLSADEQTEAREILEVKQRVNWNGLYFGGTAFKKQREVDPHNYETAAKIACSYMDVVTTSGIATGKAADTSKIKTFRDACEDTAIALASGVTPENVHLYAPLVDCVLVATGINLDGDFYNIDPSRLSSLIDNIKSGEKS